MSSEKVAPADLRLSPQSLLAYTAACRCREYRVHLRMAQPSPKASKEGAATPSGSLHHKETLPFRCTAPPSPVQSLKETTGIFNRNLGSPVNPMNCRSFGDVRKVDLIQTALVLKRPKIGTPSGNILGVGICVTIRIVVISMITNVSY